MIIRILSENQYRLDDAHKDALLNLDEDMLVAIDTNNEARFEGLLKQLLAFVQEKGEQVPDGELVTSDMIVPAPYMSLEEARKYLEENPC